MGYETGAKFILLYLNIQLSQSWSLYIIFTKILKVSPQIYFLAICPYSFQLALLQTGSLGSLTPAFNPRVLGVCHNTSLKTFVLVSLFIEMVIVV